MAGQIVHFEIPCGRHREGARVLGSLFGWKFEAFPGPTEYHMTQISEQTGGAIYDPDPPDKRGTRAYFDVADINAGAARVRELGGEAGEAMPVPQHGLVLACKDTEGNEFGLWQTDPSAPAPTG